MSLSYSISLTFIYTRATSPQICSSVNAKLVTNYNRQVEFEGKKGQTFVACKPVKILLTKSSGKVLKINYRHKP